MKTKKKFCIKTKLSENFSLFFYLKAVTEELQIATKLKK